MKKVYIVGTCDTKLRELTYARDVVERSGTLAVLVDISTGQSSPAGDVAPGDVAAHHPHGADHVFGGGDRGATLAAMGEALGRYLGSRSDLGAVLGLGGSGNTSAVTAAMRTLPVGMPKLMVSTMASGDTAPYVGPTDITMMYSVVDIAGLNDISRRVIANASRAVAGMAVDQPPEEAGAKPGLGLTMFGVTTPCVTQIRAALDEDYECYVFHATGTGGQSMEKLAESGFMTALMDVTTKSPTCWWAVSWPAPRIVSAPSSAPASPMWVRSARSTWSTSARATRCRPASMGETSTSTTHPSR